MPYFIVVLPFLKVDGLTLFPFIFVRSKQLVKDHILITHEEIHLRQQLELLVVLFYVFYLVNYLYNLLRFKNHRKAYRCIIFEQEAYQHEDEKRYLQRRKLFAPFRAIGKC